MSNPKDSVFPENELSTGSKMSHLELIQQLSDLQDELVAQGYEEASLLIHRALSKITLNGLNASLARMIEHKKTKST